MVILGISGGPRGSHEPGIVIIKNNEILIAIQEERINRNKNSVSCFPHQSLKMAFKRLNIKPSAIDIVAHPGITYSDMKKRWKIYLELNFGIKAKKYLAVHHQQCHVNAAYYSSKFDNALIITLDGVGDRSSGRVLTATNKNKKLRIIKEFNNPLKTSVGFFWDAITQAIGFESLEEAYKTMGLAPYGKANYNLKNFLSFQDGEPKLNSRYIGNQWKYLSFHPLEKRYAKKFLNDIKFKRRIPINEIRKVDCDLAASAQGHLENIVGQLMQYYIKKTKKKNIIFTGGVALNSKMCGYLNEMLDIENFFVPQLPSDGSLALGAAIEAIPLNLRHKINLDNPYLGFDYSKKEILSALSYTKSKISKYKNSQIINLLKNKGVIGFFNGKSEFGPRALGARSILALPKFKEMKDIVNSKIKFRESFRPFAPVVRDVDFDTYFERGTGNYEFMNYVVKAKKITSILAPSIVHEDGTSRVQILKKGTNNRLYKLLGDLEKIIGVGILLNTSFNLKGEPIVETPSDAIRTFYSSGLDALIIEDYILKK